MAKLTRQAAAKHKKALTILENDILTEEQKDLVFLNYQESANSVNTDFGAFFTPLSMAFEFSHDAAIESGGEYIDLCAGIGALSYALMKRNPDIKRMVCIDINPEYVAVGKKLVPEAEWYCLDVTDLEAVKALGFFDMAISNPPFGNIPSMKNYDGEFYSGSQAEYKVIDIAGTIARHGAFIIPQTSAPFNYSGAQYYQNVESGKYKIFNSQTDIILEIGMGYDTSFVGMYEYYIGDTLHSCDWNGVKPVVEFVHVTYPDKYLFEVPHFLKPLARLMNTNMSF